MFLSIPGLLLRQVVEVTALSEVFEETGSDIPGATVDQDQHNYRAGGQGGYGAHLNNLHHHNSSANIGTGSSAGNLEPSKVSLLQVSAFPCFHMSSLSPPIAVFSVGINHPEVFSTLNN